MSLSPRKLVHSAGKALKKLSEHENPKYFLDGEEITARRAHRLAGMVYHKNGAAQICGAVRLGVSIVRHHAKAALNAYVDFADKACRDVIRHAQGARPQKYTRLAEKAGRDVVRHAKRIAHGAALQMANAGGVAAQAAEGAASNLGKSARNAGSRVRGVAREMKSTGRDALSQMAAKIKSRKYEPIGYRPTETARADSESGFSLSQCVEVIDLAADQCKVEGDTSNAYATFYAYAASVAEQAVPQPRYLISLADVLMIAQLVESNLPRLHSLHLENDMPGFVTVIFDMRTQALQLRGRESAAFATK